MISSSAWALLSPEVLSGVFKLVPFDSKFACEATCISWRQVLREGSCQEMWSTSLFLVDKIEPRTVCNDPDFQGSVIVLPSSALCLPSFASWLHQRTSAMKAVSFGSPGQDVPFPKYSLNRVLLMVTIWAVYTVPRRPRLEIHVEGDDAGFLAYRHFQSLPPLPILLLTHLTCLQVTTLVQTISASISLMQASPGLTQQWPPPAHPCLWDQVLPQKA